MAPRPDLFVPMQPRMRAQDDVSAMLVADPVEKRLGGRRPPEELVDLARRSMRQKHAQPTDLQANRLRQLAHPSLIRSRRAFSGVVVGNLRVEVVPRIGIAAVAIGGSAGKRLLVISLNAPDPALDKQFRNAIGKRPE